MEFTGSINSNMSRDDTVALLKNFSVVSRCLPGLESYDEEDGTYIARIRLDISEMGNSYMSTLSGRIRASYDPSPAGKVSITASGRVAGSSLKINLNVSVSEREGGSVAQWTANVDFGILMRLMGEKNLISVAQSNIDAIMSCITKLLNSGD